MGHHLTPTRDKNKRAIIRSKQILRNEYSVREFITPGIQMMYKKNSSTSGNNLHLFQAALALYREISVDLKLTKKT